MTLIDNVHQNTAIKYYIKYMDLMLFSLSNHF